MTTTISRFVVVLLISLSVLANICIAREITQAYIIYPTQNIKQIESDDLTHTIRVVSAEIFYDYTRWNRTIPEFWVAYITPTAYALIRNDHRVNKMPFFPRTLLIGGIR